MPSKTDVAYEFKTFRFEVKAEDDAQGLISAYGSVFDNVDEGNDMVKPGAFKRTIAFAKQRIQAGKAKFLAVMLWQHDPNQPIGGWTDMVEDSKGLLCKGQIILSTQLGREAYELIKAGVIQEFSIGYDITNTGEGPGSRYNKDGVRELIQLRLWEVSPVTFAMNPEALLVGVKSMDTDLNLEYKTACGSTSGPIGPRHDSWSGSAAKKWIWSKAEGEDGKVKASVAKKYFMRCDGDPSEKGSYSYPFWVNDHISVAGVKAVANALAGARNADPEGDAGGMRKKVERLYGRINSKYPDDPLPPVPWKNDDGKSLDGMQRKTFLEHYNEEEAEDLLNALQSVWYNAFCKAIVDAFKIGDEPEVDVNEALTTFHAQFLKDWVPRAIACDLSDYLATDDMDSPLNSYYGGYGYMSRRSRMARKELLAADATTGGYYASAASGMPSRAHVDKLHKAAERGMQAITEHVDGLHSAASNIEDLLDGRDGDEDGEQTEQEEKRLAKAGRRFSSANQQMLADHADMLHDMANGHQKAMMRHLKAVRSVADDFASTMQGAEAAYGTDPGTPDEQEGKNLALALAQLKALRVK